MLDRYCNVWYIIIRNREHKTTYRPESRAEREIMKVSALTKLMNDQGTKPRIKVMKHSEENCSFLVYEGRPSEIDEGTATMKVNSFTVLGEGYMVIHAQ